MNARYAIKCLEVAIGKLEYITQCLEHSDLHHAHTDAKAAKTELLEVLKELKTIKEV